MIYLFYFLFLFIFLSLLYHFLTKKYVNPYKLILIFGKKGSGKSTLLAKYAQEYKRKGWSVYSTEPIAGVNRLSVDDIGFRQVPPRSLVIVDEAGMVWDNRNFKTFKPEVRDFFKLQRHYKLTVIVASQTFDIDKKIRDLTDEMYLVEKHFRVFSYAKKILKKVVLVEATGDAPSKVDENLVFDSLLFAFWGARKFTFIPHWISYFDSFQAPALPPVLPIQYPARPDQDLHKPKILTPSQWRRKKKK